MLIKCLGCFMIVSAGLTAGCALSKRLTARRDFLKAFEIFLTLLSTNIRYSGEEIFTVINRSAENARLDFFRSDKNCGLSFENFWAEKVNELPKKLSLDNSDKELLFEFGSQLGKTDLDGQLKHIALYSELFQVRLANAEENIIKKSKLYKAMGFFVSASVALLLI